MAHTRTLVGDGCVCAVSCRLADCCCFVSCIGSLRVCGVVRVECLHSRTPLHLNAYECSARDEQGGNSEAHKEWVRMPPDVFDALRVCDL